MKRIFLLGSERSGTNLLRTLVGNHPDVAAPPPIHFLSIVKRRDFCRKANAAPDPSMVRARIDRFINDDFSKWDLPLDEAYDSLFAPPFDPIMAMDRLYGDIARRDGKSAYFCKDNHLQDFALGLQARLDDVRLIWITRNPLDVAASWMKTPLRFATPYKAALAWAEEQAGCLELSEFYGLDVYHVRYEELIADTEAVMRGVLEACGLPFDPATTGTDAANDEAGRHDLWRNLNRPIMAGNSGKFESAMTEEEAEMAETVCAELMRRLGYETATPASYEFPSDRDLYKFLQETKRVAPDDEGMRLVREKVRRAQETFAEF